jgi:hypothetical protein
MDINGQPEYLRQQAYGSRQRLGSIKSTFGSFTRRPRHQQFEAVRSLIDAASMSSMETPLSPTWRTTPSPG